MGRATHPPASRSDQASRTSTHPSELTPDWLAEILSVGTPGVRVLNAHDAQAATFLDALARIHAR